MLKILGMDKGRAIKTEPAEDFDEKIEDAKLFQGGDETSRFDIVKEEELLNQEEARNEITHALWAQGEQQHFVGRYERNTGEKHPIGITKIKTEPLEYSLEHVDNKCETGWTSKEVICEEDDLLFDYKAIESEIVKEEPTFGMETFDSQKASNENSKEASVITKQNNKKRKIHRGKATTNLKRHKQVQKHTSERLYACRKCSKTYTHKSNFNHHLLTHTGERPFCCDICGKTFDRKASIGRHMQVHSSEKNFTCDQCNKKFTRNSTLTMHKRLFHTEERPYACDECDLKFATNSCLYYHKQKHRGKKPFACDECDRRFSCKMSLTSHKKQVHLGKKPVEQLGCNQCDRKFVKKSQLNQHMNLHTGVKPFPCDRCKKRFTLKAYFSQHKRTHANDKSSKSLALKNGRHHRTESTANENKNAKENESIKHGVKRTAKINQKQLANEESERKECKQPDKKQFACKHCSAKFSQKRMLDCHQRAHANKKATFACDQCDKTFSWKDCLDRHKQRHSKEQTRRRTKGNRGKPSGKRISKTDERYPIEYSVLDGVSVKCEKEEARVSFDGDYGEVQSEIIKEEIMFGNEILNA